MNITAWVVVAIVVLVLLFVVVRFVGSCLPKIILGLVILAAIAFLVYWYVIR
jgi:hypothetical protein